VGLSPERSDIAEAVSFHSLEGNVCSTGRRFASTIFTVAPFRVKSC
jgi:hypothetical protein